MFHPVDDAPQFYLKYRISTNGTTWSSWFQTSNLDVAITTSSGMCGFTWALSEGTVFQTYVVTTGPNKDDSEPSNTVMAIVPNAPIQSPPYLEAYATYRDGTYSSLLISNVFPSDVTGYFIWRREAGQIDWASVGYVNSRGGNDRNVESNKTYEYVIAWYNATSQKFLSDFSNLATVTIPASSSTVLLPPIRYSASFVEQNGSYYNRMELGAGDMRATKVVVQYRINNNAWSADSVMTWSEASLATFNRYILAQYSSDPIPFDRWQYRLKNRETGYTDSAWSEIFEVIVPSFLPRLDTPTLSVHQNGNGTSVIAGWNAVANAAGYKLERMQQGQSSYTLVANLGSSIVRYEDFGLSYGVTYYYRLTALGDNQYYQDSLPTVQQVTLSSIVTVPQPVIDSVVESGIDIVLTISSIDPPNTFQYRIEMSENNGSWRDLYGDYPSSMAVSTFTTTVSGSYIMEGGNLRFRVKVIPLEGAAVAPNPYSEIASITVAEREWLLRWTGSSWDYCTDVTGGWGCVAITDSERTTSASAVVATDLGNGTLRLSGSGNNLAYDGYWMNLGHLTTGNTGLSSKYSRICVIGRLVKNVEGQDYHAWLGTGWTYYFSGGTAWNMATKTIAGSDSGRGAAGEKTDPYVTACGTSQYANRYGTHIGFYFNGGFADIKGIYALKR